MHYTKANGGALDGAVSVISINGSLEYQVGRDASSSEAGIAKLYDTVPTTGGATDGAVTQQAVVNAITDVKTNIEDNELVVASALNDLDSRINNMPIIPFVEDVGGVAGTSSTNRTLWTGTVNNITVLYDGLPILIKVPVEGVAAGITLDINNLGEHPVIINASTLLTTQYAVGCIIMLVYDSSATATLKVNNTSTSFNGCWKISDYDTNTTYDGGTLAQLQAGTSGTNRLWPATVLHNYINSTAIIGSRISGAIDNVGTNKVYINGSVISGGYIGSNNEVSVFGDCISGTLGSSRNVNFGSLCYFNGLHYKAIPGSAVDFSSGISAGAIPGYTISGYIGTGSGTVYLGSNVNFSQIYHGVIPGRAISGSIGNGTLLVSLGSTVNFTGVKSGAIPADKIAFGYPASYISGSLYSTVSLYHAALGYDLATTGSLQYISYLYDKHLPVTTLLSDMLKDINDLKATLVENTKINYNDLVDNGIYAVKGRFAGVENPIVQLWYNADDDKMMVNLIVNPTETVIYNYTDHAISSVNASATVLSHCRDAVVSQLNQVYLDGNHSFNLDGTYNYESSMRILGIIS